MAEILYVDWDGLIYYDGKVKDYIDDKIKECLKFRGNVSYEELLQTSPSVDTVNTAYRLSEEFVTNEWFNKPGFAYPEGTIVYVAQFEDGTYKFDILVEPNGSNSGTDLTNYYNKQEVDNIVSELPTKEFVEKTVIDAIDSVEIDVSGLVAREELELLETKEDAEAKLTAANKYTDDQISAIMGEGVEEAYNSFKELQELMKADDGVTQTLLNDVSELKIETKALEMGKANSQHVHSANDIDGLPNYSELATKEELEAVQQTAGSNSVKLFAVESELFDINQKLDNIETPDLSDYATKGEVAAVEAKVDDIVVPEVPTKVSELDNDAGYITADDIPETDLSNYYNKTETENLIAEAVKDIEPPTVDLDGYATEEWVNTQGFLKEHQDLSDYATKDELFSKDYNELINTPEIPSIEGLASETWVNSQGFLTEHQSLEGYAKLTDIPDVSNFAIKSDIPSIEGLATEEYVAKAIEDAELSGKDVDLSNYYTKPEVDNLIPDITNLATKDEIPDVSGFTTLDEVSQQGYLLAKDIESKADKSDLENVAHTDDLATKLDVSTFNQEKALLATKEELNAVDDKIITKTSQLENDAGFLTEHQSLENYVTTDAISAFITMNDVENAGYLKEVPDRYVTDDELAERGYITDISGKSDVGHTHSYNELTDLPEIPSIDGLATTDYVDTAVGNISIPDVSNLVSRETLSIELSKKANDVLFTDNYVVTTPMGGFSADESVQNMTITQIITKLLGLVPYTPPVVPGLPENVPESTPEEIKNIIANELPAYVADGTGTIVEAEYDTYYKQMTTEESYVDSTGNHFYQVVNAETGELEESGYQIDTVEDEELWMTVAIPNTVKKFHVEQYNSKATGDDKWQKVTYTLVAEADQPIEGYTVYSVDGMDGGVTIRIVIDD